ncbi:MAG: TIGR01777 family oxidoreductase [Planctomycetales bacterium]|nr:TIGR01777 family oxidoreductase [Planctomycetales bacterium]
MRALVTGATGFVGDRLLAHLQNPVVLSRDGAKAEKELEKFGVRAFSWNPTTEPAPAEAFAGIDTVFHLAGESVASGRWTSAKKIRMRESRIAGTRNLVLALAALPVKPKVLVSASAVGYYGDRGDEILDESASPAGDYLAELCQGWEREALAAKAHGIRVVTIRIGIVLGPKGGALAKMLTPFYLGAGAPLGSGKQYMPWIHLEDLVRMMLFAAEHENVHGALNGTAPSPVTNREFTKTLGRAIHRPTFMPPVPGFMLNIMFGEFGSILLHSQRAIPKAVEQAGFKFEYPQLELALQNIFQRS